MEKWNNEEELNQAFNNFMQKQNDEDEVLRLRERLIYLAHQSMSDRNKYKSLEEATGIKARSWQQVVLRMQQPTTQMICAIAKLQPQYALWLVAGDFPAFIVDQGDVDEATGTARFVLKAEQIKPASKRWIEQAKSMANLFK